MSYELSIKKIYTLHSIYTFIPQKRIGFSNSYFIEWTVSCRPIINEITASDAGPDIIRSHKFYPFKPAIGNADGIFKAEY